MTPIIGLLVAVVIGFVASSRREVLIGVIPPMLRLPGPVVVPRQRPGPQLAGHDNG